MKEQKSSGDSPLSRPAWKNPKRGSLSILLADMLLVLLGLFGTAQCLVSAFSVGPSPLFLLPVYRTVYLSISCSIFFKAMAPSILIGLICGPIVSPRTFCEPISFKDSFLTTNPNSATTMSAHSF